MELVTSFPGVFPGGSDGKESVCNAGDLGLVPRLGKSPGEVMAAHHSRICLESCRDRGT